MLDDVLAQIRGEKSSVEGIKVDPDKIGAAGLQQIIDAINASAVEWLSITFYSGFSDVANALVSRMPSATSLKLKRLSLTFRNSQIVPADVVSLLQNTQCPFGLELAFINCIDAVEHQPLFTCKNAHKAFATALDNNDKVINFTIHVSRESNVVGEGLDYHDWTKDLSNSPAHNMFRFEFLQLIEKGRNEDLKLKMQQLIAQPENDKKLRQYIKDKAYILDIYHLFKGIVELCEDNIKDGFESLTQMHYHDSPCERDAHELLADYLYAHLQMEEQFRVDLDDQTSRARQEYLDARNRIILWLLQWSDIRGDRFSPIVNSCIRQLMRIPDTAERNAASKFLITYQELSQCAHNALYPDANKFYRRPATSMYDHFDTFKTTGWLSNEKIQRELQAKYGHSDVDVLEEIICRGLTKLVGQDIEPQTFGEIISNAQETLTRFFEDQIESTQQPTAAMAATAAASASSTMQHGASR